jgi:8-oxo-dGTP pyrophosphatase MutT (NUDIX family)
VIEPTPVHIELDPGTDHEAIERELDEQLGLTPKPKRERSWDCLAGELPLVCGHARVTKVQLGNGLADVTCTCGHSWRESDS